MRFSLTIAVFLLAVAHSFAGPYSDLNQRLRSAGAASVDAKVRESGLDDTDPALAELLNTVGKSRAEHATAVRDYVAMRALFEINRPNASSTPIADIKRSTLYRKAEDAGEGNWLQRAIERIRFNAKMPEQKFSNPGLNGGFLDFLVPVMWGILALLVAVLLFLAIRYFTWKLDRKRKFRSTAMIEDDEPERSLDEWLDLAAQLEASGRFREAIRCLYVACLLRYDEYRIARFDRTQTNWEHFRRIQASPTNPKEFDFLGRTTDFDHVWYGFRPTSSAEVQTFRSSYQELTRLLADRMVGSR